MSARLSGAAQGIQTSIAAPFEISYLGRTASTFLLLQTSPLSGECPVQLLLPVLLLLLLLLLLPPQPLLLTLILPLMMMLLLLLLHLPLRMRKPLRRQRHLEKRM